ncbi:PAS domain S-box-containing protein [Catalinimonas alkaloidigena]|uniref:histidine kinase n=1 Tax=Catalinimonas alkaloidigena TaxID=1075417 RepID=A0A1G8XP67_9BACT|nr:PAS domain-containing protein [Catalinimonas alkaloidigena]SDJ91944.1 PAS domain S-box-containing protein [Catalinimonas alkaloidigena]
MNPVSLPPSLDQLPAYATYLLDHRLQEATAENLRLLRAHQVPLLSLFAHLPEAELFELVQKGLREFLMQIQERRLWEGALGNLARWQRNELEEVGQEQIQVKDMVLINSLRRQVLFLFIPDYTPDSRHAMALVRELESFYAQLDQHALAVYVDIQQTELRRERDQFASLIENSVDGILAYDRELRITAWNRVMEERNNIRRHDILGKKIFDVFPSYEETPEGRAFMRVLAGEKVVISQAAYHTRAGFYEAFMVPLYHEDGRVRGGLSIIHDITEARHLRHALEEANRELRQSNEELLRTEAQLREMNQELERHVERRTSDLQASEEELRQTMDNLLDIHHKLQESEHFLNSVIDQSPVSTWIADATGTQIRVNEAYLKLFRLDDPLHGVGKYNLLKDETLIGQPFYKDIQAVFTEGKVATFALDYNLSEGQHLQVPGQTSTLSLVTTIFPIRDTDGNVTHAVVKHEDVTHQKKAEQALKASEEQLRLITDALPVLITYVDRDGRYRFNNRAYETWFGVSRQEIQGKHVRDVIGEAAYAKTQPAMARVLGGEAFSFEAELEYRAAGTRFVAIDFVPHWRDQAVQGYYALITDITSQKKTEKALETALAETRRNMEALKRVNAELDSFVYAASHDLRSPITNLEGLLSALQRRLGERLQPTERELLNMMAHSLGKLLRTIDDLTEIVRVERESDETPEPLLLAEVLDEVKEDLSPMLTELNGHLDVDFQVTHLHYGRKVLRSVFYNLLSNALKYRSPERPPVIRVQTFRQGNDVHMLFRDNGLGIRQDQVDKIFMLFKRLHTHVEGTGVGLYMIKRLLENRGDRIEVESTLGEGTTFRLIFQPHPNGVPSLSGQGGGLE